MEASTGNGCDLAGPTSASASPLAEPLASLALRLPQAAALAALKAKRKARDVPTTAPSVRRAAPSAPVPLSYKTSAPSSATTSSGGSGNAPKILVLGSSSPPKPQANSRNGAQNRGPLPPPVVAPPKRSYLDYDEGETVARIEPRGPVVAANTPLSSSPLASGSGYFPRPEKRPGQLKSRLGPGGASGPSVIPLRLGADGKVTDDVDDDDDNDEDDALMRTSAQGRLGTTSSSASSVMASRKLVSHNSGVSSRQSSPGSQASTSTAANLAAQFSDAFIDQDDATITRFANMFPTISRSRVVKTLQDSGWEASIAADVLLGLTPAVPIVHNVDSDVTADDFEIEEAPAKSKGVSAIYAKRRTSDLDGHSQKKKKRRHGNASDSGSGDDYGDEGTSRRKSGLQKWERDEDQEEEEALVRGLRSA